MYSNTLVQLKVTNLNKDFPSVLNMDMVVDLSKGKLTLLLMLYICLLQYQHLGLLFVAHYNCLIFNAFLVMN